MYVLIRFKLHLTRSLSYLRNELSTTCNDLRTNLRCGKLNFAPIPTHGVVMSISVINLKQILKTL